MGEPEGTCGEYRGDIAGGRRCPYLAAAKRLQARPHAQVIALFKGVETLLKPQIGRRALEAQYTHGSFRQRPVLGDGPDCVETPAHRVGTGTNPTGRPESPRNLKLRAEI